MNLKWYYYILNHHTRKICDDIVRYGQEQNKHIAITGNNNQKELTELQLKTYKKNANQTLYG